jgi:enoyl-[acyl-carrier protein] reductase III
LSDAPAPRFIDKIAVVTGSSRGIGRAIALRLARDGADVVVNFRKERESANDVVARVAALGRRAVAVQANMSEPAEITRLFETARDELGGVDFLVCNAASGVQAGVLEATVKAWDLAMNVNARSYLLCAQAAFPLMKARGGGRIVASTARIATERAFPKYSTVAASKGAINALTTYLAVEFAPHNILVNAISPGVVATDALAYYSTGKELLSRAEQQTPTGRATTVDDVAAVVAFLCSEDSRQVNGQIIEVDGGYTRLFL